MKISNDQSREIYKLAKDPGQNLTNVEIGKKFGGLDEATVRYHVRKWERKLHEISKTNGKAAGALANHAVNVASEAAAILEAVKTSIQEAKVAGVSPEKLAPLYGNWIKSLELASELLGDLDRTPQVSILQMIDHDFMKMILEEVDTNAKGRIITKLRACARQ